MGEKREIKVTPEMIEAGCKALGMIDGAHLDRGVISARALVTKILEASLSAVSAPPQTD